MKGARHQQVDQHEEVHQSESFNVPIKQKLIDAKNQACDACGTFKSNHPTMTSALMLIAVFCLGIVTSAAVGKMFVSNSHYYVSTDPHAREIHQALDTLLSHYRSGKESISGAMGGTMGAAQHTAQSYYHAAKGAAQSGYYGGKEGLASGVESAKASLDGAKATLEGYFHTPNKYDAKAAKEGLLASLSADKLSSKFGDASDYASAKLAQAQEALSAAKDAANDKIQDTLHPERHAENQFMKALHEAEHKIASFIKRG